MTVSQPLADLESVTRALYQAGHGSAAVVLRGAFSALRDAGLAPAIADIKDCPVKQLTTWAADNGVRSVPVSVDPRWPFPEYTRELLSERWLECLRTFHAHLARPLALLQAPDLIINTFGWPQGAHFNESFDLFSPSYEMGVGDPFWVPFVAGKGIYSAWDAAHQRMLIDFSGAPLERVSTPAVFLGSIRNWGHWTADFLAKTALLPDVPDRARRKLVFGTLNPRQRECLEIFGVSPDETLQLECAATKARRYQFDDLVYLPAVPQPVGYAHLRRGFRAAADTTVDGPEMIFVSRRRYAPRHRVANLDEVEASLRARGFAIADDLADLSVRQQAGMFRNARVVVLSMGADLATLSMCPPETTAVMLLPDGYAQHQPSEVLWREAASMYFHENKIVPVIGPTPGTTSLEAPAVYDVRVLDQAIAYARELAGSARS